MPSDRIPFHKLHGCGNDFVFIDNRELRLPPALMPDWARLVCRRAQGVGADGLVFLDAAPEDRNADYIWHFYNADGSRAEMCGNASRCSALLAVELGLAGPSHVIGTDAGAVRALADPQNSTAKVELTKPRDLTLDLSLNIEQAPLMLHFVNTGVPHAVVLVHDISKANVRAMGAALRYHQHFAPAGTNVNFVSVTDTHRLSVRTYERGVEDETLACGTGAAASVVVAHALGLVETRVEVKTSGGEVLVISLEDGSVFLSGSAEYTFSGLLHADGLHLPLP